MTSRFSLFLAELKRRNVGRVAAVYAAVGTAIAVAVPDVFATMLIPAWASRLVILLIILGFPVALVLAWALELTPEGVQRTPDLPPEEVKARAPERWSPSLLGFGLAAVFVLAGAGYWMFMRGGPPDVPGDVSGETSSGPAPEARPVAAGEQELVPNRVFVALFENQTGDPALDYAGRMAAESIIRDLVITGVMEVLEVDLAIATAKESAEDSGQPTLPRDVARDAGAAFLVSGSFYAQADSLVIQGQIVDVARGSVQTVLGPVSSPRSEPGVGFTELARRASGGLASLVDPNGEWGISALTHTVPYAAYAEVAAGNDAFKNQDWAEANRRFSRAFELDSTYLAPLLFNTVTLRNRRMYAQADSVRLIAETFRDRANPFERAYLDLYRAWYEGDREAAYRASERMAQLQPGGTLAFQWGYEAVRTNRLYKAVEILEGMDPSRPDLANWVSYWSRLTSAYHMLGDYQKELETALRGQEQIPTSNSPVVQEVRARIGLSQVEEAREVLEEYRSRGGGQATIRDMALEFGAHGHPEEAKEILEEILVWYDTQPDDPETQRSLRAGRAETLYYLGRWEESHTHYEELLADDQESVAYLGRLGCIAAYLGDREGALQYERRLEALDRPYLWGSNTYRRALILAVLGEADRAVGLLIQAHREGAAYGGSLHRMPEFQFLLGHPGFEEFMRPEG